MTGVQTCALPICAKKYDVYAIGNAIVDYEIEVDNAFLEANGVEKEIGRASCRERV